MQMILAQEFIKRKEVNFRPQWKFMFVKYNAKTLYDEYNQHDTLLVIHKEDVYLAFYQKHKDEPYKICKTEPHRRPVLKKDISYPNVFSSPIFYNSVTMESKLPGM